ncbi:MAG: hypothetical protein GXW90_09265 [Tepidanaerobacter acetatoxydans]|uniref:hypothetical protein n=1 Tax=Tepidanaerobacter acetatoxydans TaxID=499229 RepID=UPI0026F2C2DF|nr:hypothetical protein [Tepidanaerobacter acetatoxydans]NLU11101.1 hypothetical protein [Tepidanaerobacter acetatoxydans]
MDIFTSFTDLVLLVGTNPLPNYIVIKYFLKHNEKLKRIWLIYSEETNVQAGTEELAENITSVIKKEFLSNKPDLKFKHIPLSDVGSASTILDELQRNMKTEVSSPNIFHLNYTGGTKSMAVQTYKYFLENFGKRCTFSYLDGRDFKLKGDESSAHVTKDLRYEIGISVESLLELHGYEKKGGQNNPSYPDTVKKFEEITKLGKLNEYLCWKNNTIRGFFYKGNKFVETRKQFLTYNNICSDEDVKRFKQNFREKTPDIIFELLKTIPKQNSILDENGDIWVPTESTINKEYKDRANSVKNFLDGKWLEVYVYNVICQKIKENEKLNELYKKGQLIIDNNYEIKKKNTEKKHFEIDVILLNGYQVCGISCTTASDDSTCKNKGFEIIHRARQMGGEEAKSILIACLEDKESRSIEDFYEDLKDISGSRTHEFMVLGLKDLTPEKLWEKIYEHIWGADL